MSKAWLLLILAGFIFRTGDHWQPIHEHMHVEMVQFTGGTVTNVTHTKTFFRGGNHKAIYWFGFGGEVLLYGLFAVAFKRIGLFGLGAMLPPGWQAYNSVDFSYLGPCADLLLWSTWLGLLVLALYLTVKRYSTTQEAPQPSHIPATDRGA